VSIPSDIDIQRLIGLRNEIVGIVTEWKKHGCEVIPQIRASVGKSGA
jgi:hypothetical protein